MTESDQRTVVDLTDKASMMVVAGALVMFSEGWDARSLLVEAVRRSVVSLANAGGVIK